MKKRSLPLENKRKIKSFWRKDGTDFIAKLGKLDKAIVVRYFTPNYPSEIYGYYSIANASFLPFTEEEHKTKFNDWIDCCEFAESIVLEWMQSLFVNDDKQNLKPLEGYNNIADITL